MIEPLSIVADVDEDNDNNSGSYTEQWLLDNHRHLLGDAGTRRKTSVGQIPSVQTLLYETPGETFP
jgi:hypothetical protein